MNQKTTYYISFFALLYALVCLTFALFLPATFQTRLDNILFPIGLIHLVQVFVLNKKYRFFIGAFFLLFTWFLLAEIIAKRTLSFTSFNYIVYLLKWPVIIFSIIDNPFVPRTKERIYHIIDGVFLALVAINLFILINPNGLGESWQLLYSPKIEANFVYFNEHGTFRLVGTCMDPNNNGAIFGSFFLFYFFIRKKEAWMFALLAAFLILMTQSRTVFIGVLIICCVWLIYFLIQNKNFKKYLAIIVVGCVLISGIVLFSSNLLSLFDGKAFLSYSFLRRFDNLIYFFDLNQLNQIVGLGVVSDPKGQHGFYFDSEFIAVLFQFGLIGLILWIFLGGYLILFFKMFNERSQFLAKYTFFIIIVSFTNFTLLNSQFGVVISSFIGVCLLIEEKYRNTTAKKNPIEQA